MPFDCVGVWHRRRQEYKEPEISQNLEARKGKVFQRQRREHGDARGEGRGDAPVMLPKKDPSKLTKSAVTLTHVGSSFCLQFVH